MAEATAGAVALTEEEEFEFRRRAELESGRLRAPRPSNLAVAGQSVLKGLASVPDFAFNLPANAINLIEGTGASALETFGDEAGAAQLRESPIEPPSPTRSTLEQIGAISPSREPQTGLQRVMDRTIQAGTQAVAMPQRTLGELIKNAATLALSGFTGGVAGETAKKLGADEKTSERVAFLTQLATPMAVRRMLGSNANQPTLKNPELNKTVEDAQKAGYKIPPAMVKPSATTNRLTSLGGKAAVEQKFSIENQEVTNRLAGKAIGLADDQPLTFDAVEKVRTQSNKVYERVANVSPRAKVALQKVQDERENIKDSWRAFFFSGKGDDKRAALAATERAEQYEKVIAKEASRAGQPGLLKELHDARKLIARTYDVEGAMNVGSGNVNAIYLGNVLQHGKRPLTGELEVIGRFAKAFREAARPDVKSAGVGFWEAPLAVGAGAAGIAASGGDPSGAAAAILPTLARSGARSALSSSLYQQRLLQEPISLTQAFQQSVLAGKSAAEVQGEQ